MATVLEGLLPTSRDLLCVFCGQKESVQRIFIKKRFFVYGVKGFSRKAVHTGAEKLGKRFADDEEVETEARN
jgi:hypothetical protein